MNTSFVLKLAMLYFTILCWCKGGLDEGFSRYLLLGVSLLILFVSIFRVKFIRFRNWITVLYLVIFPLYFAISYLNPTYKPLDIKDLHDVNFYKRLQNSSNIIKADYVAKRIGTIIETNKVDKTQALALFNDLKTTYKYNYLKNVKDDVWILIQDLEKKIILDSCTFIPSAAIQDKNTLWKFYFMFFGIYIMIIIQESKISYSILRNICYFILVNAFLLSIIGIYQKINYEFSEDAVEILGIWEAPEPRYYFSTFTYKNHWSAFAIISFFVGCSLLFKPIFIWGKDLYRSKEFVFILFLLFPVVFSVPFSGSRSGTLFLSLSLMFVIIYLINILTDIKFKYKALFSFSLIFILLSIFSIFFLDKNKVADEMLNNTKIQLNSIFEGKLPLRYHLWQDAVIVGKKSPVFGWGFNSYSSINPLFQSSYVKNERSIGLSHAHTPYIPLIAHAHNDLLEWWCEWGILGLVLFSTPVLVLLFAQILSNKNPEQKLLLVAVLVMIFYSSVDFPTRTPACLAITTICLGLGVFQHTKS
jgi:O-antigen ligase